MTPERLRDLIAGGARPAPGASPPPPTAALANQAAISANGASSRCNRSRWCCSM
ncbi:MAG: hypothetical protein OXU61_13930 [Gammaproteobacteria bacterium]|nr:hypothetical protein [Gammaproteobacteria bacterium]